MLGIFPGWRYYLKKHLYDNSFRTGFEFISPYTHLSHMIFSSFTEMMTSRVGALALYTMLMGILRQYRKWPFSAPHTIKTIKSISTKIGKVD
jgi:hypothetical protein